MSSSCESLERFLGPFAKETIAFNVPVYHNNPKFNQPFHIAMMEVIPELRDPELISLHPNPHAGCMVFCEGNSHLIEGKYSPEKDMTLLHTAKRVANGVLESDNVSFASTCILYYTSTSNHGFSVHLVFVVTKGEKKQIQALPKPSSKTLLAVHQLGSNIWKGYFSQPQWSTVKFCPLLWHFSAV